MSTEATKTSGKSEPEERLLRENVIAGARKLTGQSPAVVTGALASDRRQSFTEAEVVKLTSDFVKRNEEKG